MDVRQLRHDFQNNYLRLEVLLGILNDHLQSDQPIDAKYLKDCEQFLALAQDHVGEIKKLQKSKH